MTIDEFLEARLTEDERMAREAWERTGGNLPGATSVWSSAEHTWSPMMLVDAAPMVEHIARYDPARVLREVEAKRAIMDEWLRIDSRSHQSAANYSAWVAGEREPHPGVTSPDDCERARLEMLGLALHALASVYADHPDYDPAWARPSRHDKEPSPPKR
jgi:hypothetical protein